MKHATDKHTNGETTLAVISEESYMALRDEADELHSLIEEYLSDGLTEDDLHIVKIPGGGGRAWDLPGDVSAPSFVGVILGIQSTRAYFPDEFSGASQPPLCSSRDGITGAGQPGGVCAPCPFSQWGSGKNGMGSACGQRKILYVLRPEEVLPIRVALPVTSFRNLRRYQLDLLNQRARLSGVATEFSLIQVQSKGGIKYSQAFCRMAGALDPETAQRAKAYAALLTASLSGKALSADDVAAPAPRRPDLDESDLPFDWEEGSTGSRKF